ncbi:hypothetical protein V1477_001386 [Vespula maculifrons]|uniref:Uncharacterized protein n=1 Tax=Vespula maculifrons TaxID=7453 RepID=A0ABD2CZ28_VESMC
MFNYHVERRNPCIFFERNYNSDIALSNSANSLGSSAILLGSWNFFHLRLVLLRVDVQLFIEIVQSSKINLLYIDKEQKTRKKEEILPMTSASEFPSQIAMLDD